MDTIPTKASIDIRGKKITTFILYCAVEKLKNLQEGEVLEIITKNFEPIESDIRAWCRMTGHGLIDLEKEEHQQRYYIEKAPAKEKEKTLAVVISDPGLEEILSPLGFVLGAALGGIEVCIYFQGLAMNVLKGNFKEKLHGINRLFSTFARKGLVDIGYIPPQDKTEATQRTWDAILHMWIVYGTLWSEKERANIR